MAVLPRQPTPLDRPLPLRFIFPLLFVGVYLAHLTLLRLPYYWDEAGYYIPAAYDFFRTGDVIPSTTLANAHPPLPSLYLALWWKSGFTPTVTRTAMCLITAIALLAVYRLAILLNGRPWVAATTTVLTAIYPVWFAQSTLAHADMFAAAATLWGLVFVFDGQRRPRRSFGRQPPALPWPPGVKRQRSLHPWRLRCGSYCWLGATGSESRLHRLT